jgi:two-component system OmpR family response regulator
LGSHAAHMFGLHTRRMRLLVVEDESRLALLLKRGLEEQGYVVDVTGDGAEALWLATEAGYDTIVLDVMLPSLDGLEVTRRLRAAGRWAPVLLLTARDGIHDRVVGLDAGADDYLVKPFCFAELAARVRALVRRGRVERPAVLEVGELRLDPARRQAWRGQAAVDLSPKEFALLELFLSHPGEVLTRTRIHTDRDDAAATEPVADWIECAPSAWALASDCS